MSVPGLVQYREVMVPCHHQQLGAAIHHKIDLNGASHGVSGSIQELNQICQNQLNTEELGEESMYALSLSPSDEGIRLELTVSGKNSEVVLSQLAQSV